MSTKALGRQYVNQERDAKERIHVLRLQTMAWRHVAMIATDDPARGAQLARWVIFRTLPFTDGKALEKFIEETEIEAEAAGLKSGVFNITTVSRPLSPPVENPSGSQS